MAIDSSKTRSWDDKTAVLSKYEAYNKIGLCAMVRSDLRRWGKASIAIFKLGFYAAFSYRLAHYFYLKKLKLLARCLQLLSHLITGAEISSKAVIGPGLIILHPVGVHIGPKIMIGANACICECSAIVTNAEVGEGEPIIGDWLWLSSGGKIMGPIKLGDHVWVGPNSVVLRDVESDMTAIGVPARIMPKIFRRTFHKQG